MTCIVETLTLQNSIHPSLQYFQKKWKPTMANGGNTWEGHERTGPCSIQDYDVWVQGATTLSMTCSKAYVLSYMWLYASRAYTLSTSEEENMGTYKGKGQSQSNGSTNVSPNRCANKGSIKNHGCMNKMDYDEGMPLSEAWRWNQ